MKHGKYGALVRVASDICQEAAHYDDPDGGPWEDDRGCEMYPHNVLDKIPALQAALEKVTAEKTTKGKKHG